MLTQETQIRVFDKVRACIDKAKAYYPEYVFKMPAVRYDLRGTTAGKALLREWTINLNKVLLIENLDDFLERTIPHEVAHLIDYKVNPENFESKGVVWTSRGVRRAKRDLHGESFRFIMETVLGADDSTRCHSYDTTNVKVRKTMYTYRCSCGCGKTTDVSGKVHNRIRMGAVYWLKGYPHNKAPLVFAGVNSPSRPMQVAASQAHPTPSPAKEVYAIPYPTAPVNNNSGSTKDIARRIFNTGAARGEFIAQCEKHGIKKTTASTYYQNFKSGTWK